LKWFLSPRWIIAHLVVVVVAVVFVNLGFWQLRRLDERRLANAVGESRFEADPTPIETLIAAAGDDLGSLEYRHVTATGVFHPEDEVLIRSEVHLGVAGFHVITPLVDENGTAVLVNRGWVPLAMDRTPVSDAPPPGGTVAIEGWVHPTQTRPALGPKDPAEGRLVAMNRVDIDRISQQVSYPLAPVYVVELGADQGRLPVPVDLPVFDDEGPHLGYAIQWFAFTIIGLVGYAALIRRSAKRSG
jgi:surfeit locus 1 family protein